MKLIDIYRSAVTRGMEKDPRSRKEINEALAGERSKYRKSKGPDRKAFDKERLRNPYADTRILYGNPDKDVRTVLIGVDMEGPELLAADRMNDRPGRQIDLVMAHHPEGYALARFYDVMSLQIAMLKKLGIKKNLAERLMKERMDEVKRSIAPINHARSVDIARLLDIPFMCVHTPADNHVSDYLQKLFDTKKPKKLSQLVALLKAIPEFADGLKKNAGPRILIGDDKKDPGKVFVDMTGGTEGSKKVFARLSQAGVGTIVGMHLSEDHYKHAKDEDINVVIAGHIASDTLGLNLLLDRIDKAGSLNIIPCSGFVRIKR